MSLLSETKTDQSAGGLTPSTHTDPAALLGTPGADDSRASRRRSLPPRRAYSRTSVSLMTR